MKLSVIIPSFRDPLLKNTIRSLLDNSALGDQLEVIAVLDGYWPEAELLVNDPRVKYLHLGTNEGMRNAINKGVAISRGEFIMRTDEHCMFAPGYDKVLLEDVTETDIWSARRFFLDPDKWEVMDMPPVDYEKLLIVGENPRKFSGQRWTSRAIERKDILTDEDYAMQGSMWIMSRKLWDTTIKGLESEGYGTHYGDSIEMCFKVWKAGGRLMKTKKTWYAHKHRSFPRTHRYGGQEAYDGWAFALKKHEEDYKKLREKWGF